MSDLRYPIAIEPLSDADGGGFAAFVPDLPGCMSDGDTPEEALANVKDAIATWIEAARDIGHEVPEPSKHFAAAPWPRAAHNFCIISAKKGELEWPSSLSMPSPFVFPALIEAGEKGGLTVTFPDVPEAITQGDDEADALAMAEEALGLALLTYPRRGLPLPRAAAHEPMDRLNPVAPAPEVAVKLAVLDAFRATGINKSEFARRLGKYEKEVRRILDPSHPTKLNPLSAALRALGQRLVIIIEDA